MIYGLWRSDEDDDDDDGDDDDDDDDDDRPLIWHDLFQSVIFKY